MSAIDDFDGFSAPCIVEDDNGLPLSAGLQGLLDSLGSLVPGAGIPFNPKFPQLDGKITASGAFDLKLPANATFPTPQIPEATNILSFLSPLLSAISMVMVILGPIKVVIDVLIAIINLLCGIPDPSKMIPALIKLITSLLAMAALFPIVAGLVVLLQLVKTIIAIIAAIMLILLPKLEKLIENAKTLLDNSTEAAKTGAMEKICALVQNMLNDLAIFTPINAIIDLIKAFIGISVDGVCGIRLGSSAGDDCCSDCPSIIRNPPTGTANIVTDDALDTKFYLSIDNAEYSANLLGADSLAEIGSSIPINRLTERPLLPPQPTSSSPQGSVLYDLLTFCPDGFVAAINVLPHITAFHRRPADKKIDIHFSASHELSAGNSILLKSTPEGLFDGEHVIDSVEDRVISIDAASIFDSYTGEEALDDRNYTTGIDSLRAMPEFPIESVVLIPNPASLFLEGSLSVILRNGVSARLTSSMAHSYPVKYYLIARETKAFKLGSVANGCASQVAIATRRAQQRIDMNTTPPGANGGDSNNILGVEIPNIDIDAITQNIVSRIDSPFASPDEVINLLQDELDTFSDIGARILCVIVDPINSIFSASSNISDIASNTPITFTFQPRDNSPGGGQVLLSGIPSSININSIFTTTHGTFSEVRFDSKTGTYSADLTATSAGTAEVKVFFVTSDVCSSAMQENPRAGYVQKTLNVRFIDTNIRMRRQERQYLPSAGGRRR